MTSFSGKKVLVIGGSRGIGAAIVRRFASAGATVVFTYSASQEAADAVAKQTGARAARVDSADRDAVIEFVASCGPLDVLVINAGVVVFGDSATLAKDAVDRLFAVNIHSPYFAAVEASKRMPGDGRILIIGSANGDTVPFVGITAYATSKSAVQGLARGLARELGPRGITVNVIQPGPTDTDMNPAGGPMEQMMLAGLSIKRYGKAEEVAAMAFFLAGPEAGYVTGSVQSMDGGMSG
jgi:cyclic-di-GMP-binding biofilm dispersal mediator protein